MRQAENKDTRQLLRWVVQMRGGWTHEVDALTKQIAMESADRTMRLIDDPSRAYDATLKEVR